MSSSEFRAWWWERFQTALNLRGAWISLIFIPGPLFIGVGLSGPPGGVWYLGVGIVLFLAACSYTGFLAYRTYPPGLNPQEVIGRKLTLAEIPKLPPGCVKVALLGVGEVGKTTLLHQLAALENDRPARTTDPELLMFPAPEPVRWLVYLDAAGQELPQQFEIMNHADILVLMVDHNNRGIVSVLNNRKNIQEENINQLIHKITDRQKKSPVFAVHLLRNKHDLWSKCPQAQATNLASWFDTQLQKLTVAMLPGTVTSADHSNNVTERVADVRRTIIELARKLVQQRQQ